MAKRLTEFFDPRTLEITLSDIAQGMNQPLEKISFPTSDWKWTSIFLVVIEGHGGEFVSYRILQSWLNQVIQLITNSNNWQELEELLEVTLLEIQDYPYPDSHKTRLYEVIETAKIRLETLKEKGVGLQIAWGWAKGWEVVIKYCLNWRSLNLANQLFTTQQEEFSSYPEVLEWVREIEQIQRSNLSKNSSESG